MRAATGRQWELTRTGSPVPSRAIITEAGGGLRLLTVDGVTLVETFPEAATPPLGAGTVLVPWPNRVGDGLWQLNGERQQLDLTEPDRHNAIHGLLRHNAYTVVDRTAEAITLAATVFPQHGYPFQLDTTVRYELAESGLTVTHRITNVSAAPSPVAVGAHPYLRIGDVPTADLTLTLAAQTHFEVDSRLIPVGERPVAGGDFDFRSPRPVAGLRLDDAFGDLIVTDGVSRHTLRAPDGRSVTLWQDAAFGYLQAFTTSAFPGRELAIALEPMSAPANAFNSGRGLQWLQPDRSWAASWGIVYQQASV